MGQHIKGVQTRYLGNFTTANLPTVSKLLTLEEGDIAYDTTAATLKLFNGTAWGIISDGSWVQEAIDAADRAALYGVRQVKDAAEFRAKTDLEAGVRYSTQDGLAWDTLSSGTGDFVQAGVQVSAVPRNGYVNVRQFPDISTAIRSADAKACWLDWENSRNVLTAAQTFTMVNPIRWVANGASWTYNGAAIAAGPAVTFDLPPTGDSVIEGSGLLFDADRKAARAALFRQTTPVCSNQFFARNLTGANAYLTVTNYSGSGLSFSGGYAYLHLVGGGHYGCVAAAGAENPGTTSISGISVFSSAGEAYSRNTLIDGVKMSGPSSEDPARNYDMDSIVVLANPTTNMLYGPSVLEVRDLVSKNSWGRDVKAQTGRLDVSNPRIICDEGPDGGRSMPFIASQYGPLNIVGGQLTIKDVAVGSIVNVAGSDAIGNSASKWSATSIDLSGTATIETLLFHAPTSGPAVKTVSKMDCISVNGGSVTRAAEVRTNGDENDIVFISGCVAKFTGELVRAVTRGGGVSPYFAKVVSDNNVNLGAEVPTVRYLETGVVARVKASDANSVGFSLTPFIGLTGATFGGLAAMEYRGSGGAPNSAGLFPLASDRFFCVQIDAGASYDLPFHGSNNSNLVLMSVNVPNRQHKAIFATDAAGVVALAAGEGVKFGVNAEPADGDWRIWRSASGVITVKNATAANRTVSFSQT